MKNYAPSEIRNFAIVGHASAGKTLLSEAMLRCAMAASSLMSRIFSGLFSMPLPSAENTVSSPARKCVAQGWFYFALAKRGRLGLKCHQS